MKKEGQIVLIILLIMVVLLTIVLSLVSHSIIDISLSKDEEEAMRAFSAAEAGIEEVLRQNPATWGEGRVNVEGTEAYVKVSQKKNTLKKELKENEIMTIYLNDTGSSQSYNLTFTWPNNTALEITFYQKDGNLRRLAYKGLNANCAQGDGFITLGGSSISQTLNSQANDSFVRVRVLCASAILHINSAPDLPTQAFVIQSQAASGSQIEKSKISSLEVTQSQPALPDIFDYVLFSQGSIN